MQERKQSKQARGMYLKLIPCVVLLIRTNIVLCTYVFEKKKRLFQDTKWKSLVPRCLSLEMLWLRTSTKVDMLQPIKDGG